MKRLELFLQVHKLPKGYSLTLTRDELRTAVVNGKREEHYKSAGIVTDKELGEFIDWMEDNWGVTVCPSSTDGALYVVSKEEVMVFGRRY